MPDTLVHRQIAGPLGSMSAAAVVRPSGQTLCLLEFAPTRTDRGLRELESALSLTATEGGAEVLDQTERELTAYAKGELTQFTVPLETPGSDWQQRVWGELLKIPFGQTTSYGQLAENLGSPGGARAVGLANGQNRISIIVPCHRVIAADGTLHGYGGGLDRKRALLELEGAMQPEPALFD